MSHCKGYLKEKYPDLYSTWSGMKTRCNNPNADNYERYGGKGVICCAGLSSFSNFKEILGVRPTKSHSLDRIKSELNYSCGECEQCKSNGWSMNIRWATRSQQSSNRPGFVNTLSHNGEEHTLEEWAKLKGIKRSTLNHRINTMKWSVDAALTIPVKRGNRVVFKGKIGNNQYKNKY